jgi:hypothetical protein
MYILMPVNSVEVLLNQLVSIFLFAIIDNCTIFNTKYGAKHSWLGGRALVCSSEYNSRNKTGLLYFIICLHPVWFARLCLAVSRITSRTSCLSSQFLGSLPKLYYCPSLCPGSLLLCASRGALGSPPSVSHSGSFSKGGG